MNFTTIIPFIVHTIINDLVEIIIITWLVYSILVVIYLNILTQKYLQPIAKDDIIRNKTLKSSEDLIKQCEHKTAINILVLSGGGLRGLVPLHILSYIETVTGKKCGELFDFVSGSSTGAISAAGFTVADSQGNYKFSAKNILDRYEYNSNLIFSSPWYHQFLTLFGLFAPRFLPDGKMAVLDSYFSDLTLSDLKGNLLIPVYNLYTNSLQMVKNWRPLNGQSNDNFLVKDLINGASSPPMLFPPMAFSLNKQNHMFIDPAVILNNPALHVLLYLQGLFPNTQLNIVLIGNGGTSSTQYNYKNMFAFGLYGLYQYLFSAPTLSSKLTIEFIEQYLNDIQYLGQDIKLFRVNSVPDEVLSATSTSKRNLRNIRQYAYKMLEENYETIDRIINAINHKNLKEQ